MKISRFLPALLFPLLFASAAFAGPGDTTVVQVFTFGSAQDSTVLFPSDTIQYEKILMFYTLKCVPGNNPACGEWDYLTYTFVYVPTGEWDSTVASIDTLNNDTTWNYYEVEERFEIARYITPYGIGLDLGDGFTWIFDISDYRTLLADSVHISAGNWQELLDLKIVMIEGTPPRDILGIQNLWVGSPTYTNTIENFLTPMVIPIDSNVAQARLKIRTTGHGFGGNQNCAEFCPKTHHIDINGFSQVYSQYLWRNNCALNPLWPQGGTWIYDRANWCPGAEVGTDDYELSSWITPGGNLTLDYDMEPYTYTGGGSTPYYRIETQLVTYGAPHHALDAAVSNVLAPSNQDMQKRHNPVCNNPKIVIKNNGTTTLTSLTISYGTQGGTMSTYNWTGSLPFLEEEVVQLGNMLWDGSPNTFVASVSAPNGGTDEYALNDTWYQSYDSVPVMDASFYLKLKCNSQPQETRYELKDDNGTLLYQSSPFWSTFSVNRDTFNLAPGCYHLRIYDTGSDGLDFFANTDGTGYAELWTVSNSLYKVFNPDFGKEINYWFKVDNTTGVDQGSWQEQLDVYPNPSEGIVNVDMVLAQAAPVQIDVLSLTGERLKTFQPGTHNQLHTQLDLRELPAGMYLLKITTGNKSRMKKVILYR